MTMDILDSLYDLESKVNVLKLCIMASMGTSLMGMFIIGTVWFLIDCN